VSSFREDSKANYISGRTIPEINCGSLQRIADGVEKTGERYDTAIRSRDSALNDADRARNYARLLEHRVRGLRGALTRIKNKRNAQ
jgi:hypothetical protein